MWFRRATTRLIAIHLVLVALSTAVVLALVYYQTRSVIRSQTREVIEAELRGLSDDYRTGGAIGLARAIERRMDSDLTGDGVYLLADAEGRRVAGNLGDWPPVVPAGGGWVEVELYRRGRDRAAAIAAVAVALPDGGHLLVGRDSQAQMRFRATLLRALGWALGVSGVLALASGWYLSRFVGRRVGDVVATAEEIVQGDMTRRVPVRGGGDEFDRLAATLNRMLDRIQVLVGDLRMVTDGVAHDLRSPLTRLRGHLDASLEEGIDEAARRERLGRAVAEADGVLRSFTALMEIARAEAGLGRDQFEAIDLGALAGDVIDLYTPMAADREVRLLRTGEGATVQGHRQLLANAVANLVENALAHAPRASTVTVALDGAPAPALTVADHGPGIPEDARETVLKRFVRLDASRGRPGAGLGLSLVAAVARLHGAAFDLAENRPGLRATLRFAAAARPGKTGDDRGRIAREGEAASPAASPRRDAGERDRPPGGAPDRPADA